MNHERNGAGILDPTSHSESLPQHDFHNGHGLPTVAELQYPESYDALERYVNRIADTVTNLEQGPYGAELVKFADTDTPAVTVLAHTFTPDMVPQSGRTRRNDALSWVTNRMRDLRSFGHRHADNPALAELAHLQVRTDLNDQLDEASTAAEQALYKVYDSLRATQKDGKDPNEFVRELGEYQTAQALWQVAEGRLDVEVAAEPAPAFAPSHSHDVATSEDRPHSHRAPRHQRAPVTVTSTAGINDPTAAHEVISAPTILDGPTGAYPLVSSHDALSAPTQAYPVVRPAAATQGDAFRGPTMEVPMTATPEASTASPSTSGEQPGIDDPDFELPPNVTDLDTPPAESPATDDQPQGHGGRHEGHPGRHRRPNIFSRIRDAQDRFIANTYLKVLGRQPGKLEQRLDRYGLNVGAIAVGMVATYITARVSYGAVDLAANIDMPGFNGSGNRTQWKQGADNGQPNPSGSGAPAVSPEATPPAPETAGNQGEAPQQPPEVPETPDAPPYSTAPRTAESGDNLTEWARDDLKKAGVKNPTTAQLQEVISAYASENKITHPEGWINEGQEYKTAAAREVAYEIAHGSETPVEHDANNAGGTGASTNLTEPDDLVINNTTTHVEAGESWESILDDMGITDDKVQQAVLQDAGPELANTGDAYWDNNAKEWRLNLRESGGNNLKPQSVRIIQQHYEDIFRELIEEAEKNESDKNA